MDANFSYYNGSFCCTKLALFLVPFQGHTDAFCRCKNIFYHVSRSHWSSRFTWMRDPWRGCWWSCSGRISTSTTYSCWTPSWTPSSTPSGSGSCAGITWRTCAGSASAVTVWISRPFPVESGGNPGGNPAWRTSSWWTGGFTVLHVNHNHQIQKPFIIQLLKWVGFKCQMWSHRTRSLTYHENYNS